MPISYVDAFMQIALREAERALLEGEVPVGCVFVDIQENERLHARLTSSHEIPASVEEEDFDQAVVARGRNQTNVLRHALAHAEFIAVQQLLDDGAFSHPSARATDSTDLQSATATSKKDGTKATKASSGEGSNTHEKSCARTLRNLSSYVLYVTVEPCVMCGAMLLYNEIGHVFFGCRNPRFGGNGTVLALQEEPLLPRRQRARNEGERRVCDSQRDGGKALVKSEGSPLQCTRKDDGGTSQDKLNCEAESEARVSSLSNGPAAARTDEAPASDAYDGPWWPGYTSEGGHREAEAIAILQQFYERENPNAPGHKRRLKPGTC